MEQRRKLKSDEHASHGDLNKLNKEISREIRKDIRKHRNEKIVNTIEDNKSMKIMRRKLTNGKKEIVKLKDKNDSRKYLQGKVQNQGSEDVPEISVSEIYNALKKMKNNKAPGDGGVVTEAIKMGETVLMTNIQRLFNLCLENQNIPTKWNNSIIILLDKKGDIADLENYRPISLLNHLYKLAKLDFYQPKEQAGFRSEFGPMIICSV
ncbi:uncharacterized protein LOC115879096 [Sitophilus oryzae]|uniref:Uncharacterized protein LOC115879096 n=1 Tax=Sitophilus oryzae TaxID=7048 RepID=A0A6J2XL34_SITOR|nr:uncharacterized protein LOC115879096 [Sitophilus oryzae]